MESLWFTRFYIPNPLSYPELLNKQSILIKNHILSYQETFWKAGMVWGGIKFVSHGGFFKVAQHSTVVVGIILII